MGDYKYKAFISYSHKDRKWTRWLHRRLETYPIPKNIIGKTTPAGIIPRRLKPIFRDREELSASNNLGEKIQAALASSKNLIIICSPAAAKSKWVNQEILTFKQNNRDAQLFSVIVEGEPYASTMPGREAEECFPPALRFEVNADGTLSDSPAEPLAADLRPHADGKRLGFLKLLSGMIGVGLDEVVQRDMKRSRKRVTAITTGSLATVLIMGALTGFALTSQKEAEAQRSIAQARTASAEELIEFMVTDLKDKLDEVGRLDALQAVGQEASDYYDQYELSEHDDDSLGRRARVFHYLGEIQDDLGNLKEASANFQKAFHATDGLLKRNPDQPNRVFEHAQSVYWVARVPWKREEFANVEPYYQEYKLLAKKLYSLEPRSNRSVEELGYASTNLGSLYYKTGQIMKAKIEFEKALYYNKKLSGLDANNTSYQFELANTLAWLSDSHLFEPTLEKAIKYRVDSIRILEKQSEKFPLNYEIKNELMISKRALTRLYILNGEDKNTEKSFGAVEKLKQVLMRHDPSNVEWLKEATQLSLLKVEYLLLRGELRKASQLLLDIETDIHQFSTKLPESDRQVQRILVVFKVLKIYEMIALDRVPEAKDKLRDLLKSQLNQNINLNIRPELIDIKLLQHLLFLEKTVVQEISQLCLDERLNLYPTYVSKVSAFVYHNSNRHKMKACRITLEKFHYPSVDLYTWAQKKFLK